jgi:rubrerythrin
MANTNDSVFDRLVKVLDTNFGYVDEEPAEKVAKRIMRAGLLREVKPEKWEFLYNALDGTPCYRCPICKEVERRKTNFCPNCGAVMRKDEDDK